MAAIKGLRRAILLLVGNLALLVLLFLLIEGGASLVLFARDVSRSQPIAERLHTVYDAELGWVNQPGVHYPDMYGKAIALTTNARGFRGADQVDSAVVPGRVRLICSGDSFTLGYGVSDDETWCHQLMQLDARLETVNMGQGGYGFDQAYLWYRRDGVRVQHHLHLFAFISDDFRRMEDDNFLGYSKPLVKLEGGSLRIDNVPVPRHSYGKASWFTQNAEPLRKLRIVQFAIRLRARGSTGLHHHSETERRARQDSTRQVVARMLQELKHEHDSRGSHLVLVLLPTTYELAGQPPEVWREFFTAQASELGLTFVDLFPVFRAMSEEERVQMFIKPGEVNYPGAQGHFSRAGNARVAELLYGVLESESLLVRETMAVR